MKQKYLIFRKDEESKLVIQEFAELDKEILTLICEETYDDINIKSAIEKGKDFLVSELRTQNLYPINLYTDKIAESVITLYNSGDNESMELFFDDIEFLAKDSVPMELLEDFEEAEDDIDDLLKDEFDEDFEDKGSINKINAPLKVADDETLDIDDDN
ncbi:MAG: hypothetical protein JW786_14700 [Desulfobacterales bacterium]|nr:hypothetical protein [Desulfobacterales bacterium]